MTTQFSALNIRAIYCLLFMFLGSITAFSQTIILSEKTQVSVLTCDSGIQLHSLFGHTALRINDPVNGFDAVYNFGYFDFNTPNFYLKFVKGDMKYFAAVDSFENFMPEYVYLQRGVYEQYLNLSQIQMQHIFDDLNQILQSDKKFYTYKFIDRNCTTMVVDLINKNIDNKISNKIKAQSDTNREILYGYLNNHFYESLGINIIFGAKADRKFTNIFLPMQFLEGLQLSKNQNAKLVSATKTLNPHSASQPFSIWNNCYSLILFLAIIVVVNKRWLTISYFTLTGIIGILLFSVAFYSFHEEVHSNYNIFLFNPLYIFLALSIARNLKKTGIIIVYIITATLVCYTIYISGKPFFIMFLPFIIANSILLYKVNKTLRLKD